MSSVIEFGQETLNCFRECAKIIADGAHDPCGDRIADAISMSYLSKDHDFPSLVIKMDNSMVQELFDMIDYAETVIRNLRANP